MFEVGPRWPKASYRGGAAALRTAIESIPHVPRRRFREVPEAYSVQ
jgi:hypothetical protein